VDCRHRKRAPNSMVQSDTLPAPDEPVNPVNLPWNVTGGIFVKDVYCTEDAIKS
jgi:hypothetical protein